jgi:hypothetical protein
VKNEASRPKPKIGGGGAAQTVAEERVGTEDGCDARPSAWDMEAKVNYCCLCIIPDSSVANTNGYGLDTFAGGPDRAGWQEGKEQKATQ